MIIKPTRQITLWTREYGTQKWNAISLGEKEDSGYEQCPLCMLFREPNTTTPTCTGCPIGNNCEGTPYMEWIRHHRDWHIPPGSKSLRVLCDECRKIALMERDFLYNLLLPSV